MRSFLLCLVLALVLMLTGCASARGPYSPRPESARDSIKAQRLTQQAAKETDPARAEELLREALTADIFFGPAHNNYGVLLLKKGMLFEAAQEFQWAQKTLPGHPDPRMNLALTLEKAGRTDEALTAYTSALEVYKDHIPTIQAMTRLQLKAGRANETTLSMLKEIALKGEDQRWREWARAQKSKLSK